MNTPGLSLIVSCNEGQHDRNGRVAFIAGKKLGNAVWRNRAKRRMRAICRQVGGPFPGYDVAFVARKRVNEITYENMINQVSRKLAETGLIE